MDEFENEIIICPHCHSIYDGDRVDGCPTCGISISDYWGFETVSDEEEAEFDEDAEEDTDFVKSACDVCPGRLCTGEWCPYLD